MVLQVVHKGVVVRAKFESNVGYVWRENEFVAIRAQVRWLEVRGRFEEREIVIRGMMEIEVKALGVGRF